MKEKSLGYILEETKADIIKAINESVQIHNIPIYLLEYIIRDIYEDVTGQKKAQITEEIKFWAEIDEEKKRLEEEKKEEKKK